MFGKGTDVQKTNISDQVKDNRWLFVIVSLGIGLLITGVVLWNETLVAIGAAFIIAGGVGIYMMLATRQVAKQLHLRFNEQNEILDTQTGILKRLDVNSSKQNDILERLDVNSSKQTDILREIASSQKEMASSQKEMASSQKEIASSQKEMASSQTKNNDNVLDALKRIEDKL